MMARRIIPFACEGATLFATLDMPDGPAPKAGLLIVSGGNEIRSGAWGGQAKIAASIAARGVAVLRFDRRGVGDSEGVNHGFRTSGPDIAAALDAFRAAVPSLMRVVAHGNCDAASALMLARGAGVDGLVLSNPWTQEADSAPPSPAALRAHYARRMSNPGAILRLLTGRVSPRRLMQSLWHMGRPSPQPAPLLRDMAEGLAAFDGPVRLLLAGRDATAQAFLGVWDASDPRLAHCPGASHSFVEPEAQAWLEAQLLAALGKA